MPSALPLVRGGSRHAPVSAPAPALLLQSPRVPWCCHQPQHVGNLCSVRSWRSQQTRAEPVESPGQVCGLAWDASTCLGQRCWCAPLCRQAERHEGARGPVPSSQHSLRLQSAGLGAAVPTERRPPSPRRGGQPAQQHGLFLLGRSESRAGRNLPRLEWPGRAAEASNFCLI